MRTLPTHTRHAMCRTSTVQTLNLLRNQIGDAGVTALADACASGALPALKELYLHENKIADTGMIALADAVGRGALPALQTLFMDSPSAELTSYCASKSIKLNTH